MYVIHFEIVKWIHVASHLQEKARRFVDWRQPLLRYNGEQATFLVHFFPILQIQIEVQRWAIVFLFIIWKYLGKSELVYD